MRRLSGDRRHRHSQTLLGPTALVHVHQILEIVLETYLELRAITFSVLLVRLVRLEVRGDLINRLPAVESSRASYLSVQTFNNKPNLVIFRRYI